MGGTREKKREGMKKERKRGHLEREKQLQKQWTREQPSVANSKDAGARRDEEEAEEDSPDWLTRLSAIKEKYTGSCFLGKQVLKIHLELKKEVTKKQRKGEYS